METASKVWFITVFSDTAKPLCQILINDVPGNLGTGRSASRIFVMKNTEGLADAFASKVKSQGATIRPEDNASRLHDLTAKLPKRLPTSFESLLSRYSFSTFDAAGISFFGWGPESTELSDVASPQRGSLSE